MGTQLRMEYDGVYLDQREDRGLRVVFGFRVSGLVPGVVLWPAGVLLTIEQVEALAAALEALAAKARKGLPAPGEDDNVGRLPDGGP